MKNIIDKILKIDNKKKIIIIIIILIIGVVSSLLIINKNNNKLVLNDKPVVEDIKVDSKINEITVVSSRIEKSGKSFSIFVKIKNNTDSVIENSNLKLSILDKNNEVILESIIENVPKLEIGSEVEFQVSSETELKDVSKYIVEKVE